MIGFQPAVFPATTLGFLEMLVPFPMWDIPYSKAFAIEC
jgi:hypothetical protein